MSAARTASLPRARGHAERGPTDCAVAKGRLQPPIPSPDRGVLWGDLRARGEKLAGRGGVSEVEETSDSAWTICGASGSKTRARSSAEAASSSRPPEQDLPAEVVRARIRGRTKGLDRLVRESAVSVHSRWRVQPVQP